MTALTIAEPLGGWPPPWPLLREVANQIAGAPWALVGGLMVQAHAKLSGVPPVRVTDDVDLLIDVLANRSAASNVAVALQQIGFVIQEPGWEGSPIHRLRRGDEVVDILVADHLPRHLKPSLASKPVMAIDGGAQALDRTMEVAIDFADSTITVRIPHLLGALILKAAAARTDSRDKGRHLQDAALLAALVENHAVARSSLKGSDKRRLGTLAACLDDPAHPAWLALSPDLAQRGQDTLRILTA